MPPLSALAVTRWLVGLAALIEICAKAPIMAKLTETMRSPLLDWLPLPGSLLPLYVGLWVFAALAFAAGWHVRISGPVLAVLMVYALLIDQQVYSNHLYLMLIVVLVLLLPPRMAQRWLRRQLVAVYAFGALSKLNLIYISGGIIAVNLRDGWLLPFPDALMRWEVMVPLAMLSIALDGFLAFAFWLPRYRNTGLVMGLGFHTVLVLIFPMNVALQLAAFALTMAGLYCAFVDPAVVLGRCRVMLHWPIPLLRTEREA